VSCLIGNGELLKKVQKERYFGDGVGQFTMDDILAELAKPGRDPRASFEAPKFRDDVRTLEDLKVGMELEGIVTNVTAFGAFVDVGVHQDGLVHVSKLSDKFVKDPSTVVKVGAKIRVRVLGVDLGLRRISLSARKEDGPRPAGEPSTGKPPAGSTGTGRGAPAARQPPQRGNPQQGNPRSPQQGKVQGGKPTQGKPGTFANNPFAKLLGK
jgi:uncharacterized protein